MPRYRVEMKYVRPDSSVEYWLGGMDPAYLDYVVQNYIITGKVLNEYCIHNSAVEKIFVRDFDSQQSWITFRDDPNRNQINADRVNYCNTHGITCTRTETEIPD